VFHMWHIGMLMICCVPNFMYWAWMICCILASQWTLNKIFVLLPYCYCTFCKTLLQESSFNLKVVVLFLPHKLA